MNDLWPIVASVLGVFLVMLIGAICRRVNWITRESDHSLASVITNVLLPAYLVSRILSGPPFDSGVSAWYPPAFGFAMTGLGFGIAFLFAKRVGPHVGLTTDSQQRAFALCVGICNYGYIPLPLAESFYPDAVVPLILHNVGVELALWSVGVGIISGGNGKAWHKVLLSPPFLAVLFACCLKPFVDPTQIPTMLSFVFNTLGNCAIPLGLLLSGAIMMDFLSDTSWMKSYKIPVTAILLRQLLMPCLMITTAMLFSVGTSLKEVILLQAAMPAAVFPIVLVRLYDRDTTTSIQVIVSTSMAGFLLIPAWLIFGQWIFAW
ncbi:AEC family transporter [bacterium]|nr:AEC family transporter [bacterium]